MPDDLRKKIEVRAWRKEKKSNAQEPESITHQLGWICMEPRADPSS